MKVKAKEPKHLEVFFNVDIFPYYVALYFSFLRQAAVLCNPHLALEPILLLLAVAWRFRKTVALLFNPHKSLPRQYFRKMDPTNNCLQPS